jgi:hypothetical protein
MGFTDAGKGRKCLLPSPLSSSFFAAKHLPSCKKSLSSFLILCLCLWVCVYVLLNRLRAFCSCFACLRAS